MSIFSGAIARGPVTKAEYRFQQRSSARKPPRGWLRRILRWPWYALLWMAVAGAIILLAVEFATTLTGFDLASLPAETHNFIGVFLFLIPITVLIPLTLLIHFRTQLRTLALAANSISREKRGGTWDVLLLTGVDARQIVRGKWWATVRYVWRSYALLMLLRSAALVWVVWEANRIAVISYPTFHIEIRPHYSTPSLPYLLAGCVLIAVFTLFNMGYTVAFGTLGSVFNRGGGTSLALAIAIRTLTLLAVGAAVGLTGHFILVYVISYLPNPYDPTTQLWQLYQTLVSGGLSMVDGGAIVSAMITSFIPPSATSSYSGASFYYNYSQLHAALVGSALAFGLMIALGWLALVLAQALIVRQAALRPRSKAFRLKKKWPVEALDGPS